MEAKVLNLDQEEVGAVELSNEIFGIEPSETILNMVVNWQRAKKQAGTHKTKNVSEVSGTGKKPFKQKGTGNARMGTLRATQCRGGGVPLGPVPRDHSHKLPKKVRKLGLKMALSARIAEGKISIIEALEMAAVSTKEASLKLEKFYNKSLMIVDCSEQKSENFIKSVRNVRDVHYIKQIGINVFDLLKNDNILITKSALVELEERLK